MAEEAAVAAVATAAVMVAMVVVLVIVMLQVVEVALFLLLLVVVVWVEVMVVVALVITLFTRLILCSRHRGKHFSCLIYSPRTLRDGHYYPYFIDAGPNLYRVHSPKLNGKAKFTPSSVWLQTLSPSPP